MVINAWGLGSLGECDNRSTPYFHCSSVAVGLNLINFEFLKHIGHCCFSKLTLIVPSRRDKLNSSVLFLLVTRDVPGSNCVGRV